MKKIFIGTLILLLASCISNQDINMSTTDCKQTKTCSLSGMLIVNGDKGFIGELQVEENKCVNVSLPDSYAIP